MSLSAAAPLPLLVGRRGQYLLQDLPAKYIVNIVHKQMTTAVAAASPDGGGGAAEKKLPN